MNIKVLVVDDSQIIRQILQTGLESHANIQVVGTASDPFEARDLIIDLDPDVITLDVMMPKMNGLDFLKKLMHQHPIPVVMVSSATQRGKRITIEALNEGAVDFVPKPDETDSTSLVSMISALQEKIIVASRADVKIKQKAVKTFSEPDLTHFNYKKDIVIGIGASTGGTTAISGILSHLPSSFPPILISQHMPEGFTNLFAQRLNDIIGLTVKEAQDGEVIKPSHVYVAPGNHHLLTKEKNGQLTTVLTTQDKVNGHRPSVDVLFNSLAEIKRWNTIGVLLTGMGNDGAKGLLNMRMNGATVYAQDEQSSVVFGMPKAALQLNAVLETTPLNQISEVLLNDVQLK